MDLALNALLRLARRIDHANAAIGRAAAWLVLAACLVSVANSLLRYGAHFAQQLLVDLPTLCFAAIVLGAAPKTLAEDGHIRVDILFRALRPRACAMIDVIGSLVFLLPFCVLIIVMGSSSFLASWRIAEASATPGGMPQWAARALIPAAFALLLVQGVAQLVKGLATAIGLEPPPPPTSAGPSEASGHSPRDGAA
jgi:TRAP-type mannitol/chloroaromatic compound transport system permease small subunit